MNLILEIILEIPNFILSVGMAGHLSIRISSSSTDLNGFPMISGRIAICCVEIGSFIRGGFSIAKKCSEFFEQSLNQKGCH